MCIKENPLKAGLTFLPFIYTVTIFVNIGGIVESSPPLLGFDFIPAWGKILIVVVISGLVYLGVWLIVVPYMKKKIESKREPFRNGYRDVTIILKRLHKLRKYTLS